MNINGENEERKTVTMEEKHTKNVIISKWCSDEKKNIISNNSDEIKAAKPMLADIHVDLLVHICTYLKYVETMKMTFISKSMEKALLHEPNANLLWRQYLQKEELPGNTSNHFILQMQKYYEAEKEERNLLKPRVLELLQEVQVDEESHNIAPRQIVDYSFTIARSHSWYKHIPQYSGFAFLRVGFDKKTWSRGFNEETGKYKEYLTGDGTQFHYTWMPSKKRWDAYNVMDYLYNSKDDPGEQQVSCAFWEWKRDFNHSKKWLPLKQWKTMMDKLLENGYLGPESEDGLTLKKLPTIPELSTIEDETESENEDDTIQQQPQQQPKQLQKRVINTLNIHAIMDLLSKSGCKVLPKSKQIRTDLEMTAAIHKFSMHTYNRLYENGFVDGHDLDGNPVDLTKIFPNQLKGGMSRRWTLKDESEFQLSPNMLKDFDTLKKVNDEIVSGIVNLEDEDIKRSVSINLLRSLFPQASPEISDDEFLKLLNKYIESDSKRDKYSKRKKSKEMKLFQPNLCVIAQQVRELTGVALTLEKTYSAILGKEDSMKYGIGTEASRQKIMDNIIRKGFNQFQSF